MSAVLDALKLIGQFVPFRDESQVNAYSGFMQEIEDSESAAASSDADSDPEDDSVDTDALTVIPDALPAPSRSRTKKS